MGRQLGDIPGLDFLGVEQKLVAVQIGHNSVLGVQLH